MTAPTNPHKKSELYALSCIYKGNKGQLVLLNFCMAAGLRLGKVWIQPCSSPLKNWTFFSSSSGGRVGIYSVSQKWVHSSYFYRYLIISLHGTTLTKWHFDTMKSSLCAAYITELIYFPLKIAQNITIKSSFILMTSFNSLKRNGRI